MIHICIYIYMHITISDYNVYSNKTVFLRGFGAPENEAM